VTSSAARHRQSRWQRKVSRLVHKLKASEVDSFSLPGIWADGYRVAKLVEEGESYQFELAIYFTPHILNRIGQSLSTLDDIVEWLKWRFQELGGTQYRLKRFPQYNRKEMKIEGQRGPRSNPGRSRRRGAKAPR